MLKIISEEASGRGQAVYWKEVLSMVKHKLRIIICSNSHPVQSYAVIDRWDGTNWQEVHRLLNDSIAIEHGIGYKPEFHSGATVDLMRKHVATDRKRLLDIATKLFALS